MTLLVRLKQRFGMRGVFWRELLAWSTRNVPHEIEPLLLACWTMFFFVLWRPGRRAVVANLRVVTPKTNLLVLYGRAFRVFWNFACTFTDTMRFSLDRVAFDWQVEGAANFAALQSNEAGAIVLTAHMGNYDLGSYLFAERIGREVVIVRAAETDRDSDRNSREHRERIGNALGTLRFFEPSEDLALLLVSAIREKNVVAIQGDRIIEGVAGRAATLFGHPVQLPAGPFALALATGAPMFPLFIARDGRRRYRVIAPDPIVVARTGRDRERDLDAAMARWTGTLETVIRSEWHQWFTFFPYFSHAE